MIFGKLGEENKKNIKPNKDYPLYNCRKTILRNSKFDKQLEIPRYHLYFYIRITKSEYFVRRYSLKISLENKPCGYELKI